MPEPINLKEQEQDKQHVILIPGGFKPPTGGHYQMIKHYDKKPDVRKVFVVTGPKPRGGITLDQSKKIFQIYGGFSSKVDFITTDDPTPLTTCYELMKNENFVNQFPKAQFSIGASDKEDDAKRIFDFVNYFRKNDNLSQADIGYYDPAPAHSVGGAPASASRMRKAYDEQDWETFKKLLPNPSLYDNVVQIMNNSAEQEGADLQENFFTLDSLFSLVNEVYSEKQRRYMCAMKDLPAGERPKGLSAAEAEEMCKSKELKKKKEINEQEEAESSIAAMAEMLISKALVASGIPAGGVSKAIGEKLITDVTELINNTIKQIPKQKRQDAQAEEAEEMSANLDSAAGEEIEEPLDEMSAVTTVGAMGHMDNSRGKRDERQRNQA